MKQIVILSTKTKKDLELLQIAKRLAAIYNSKLSIVDLNGSINQPQVNRKKKNQ
ncbi:hypothetical protein [Leptospira kirschneri]|uniref:hypothetical protein n=1 Tax=Leptospira kirschneri TaxID=29507 RepID=UPI00034AD7BA